MRLSMTVVGHSRRFNAPPVTSVLPPGPDIADQTGQVGFVPPQAEVGKP